MPLTLPSFRSHALARAIHSVIHEEAQATKREVLEILAGMNGMQLQICADVDAGASSKQ